MVGAGPRVDGGNTLSNQEVILVGAPRSGTNMLRDILTTLEGVSTWPCDEINYIWRHGNARYPSDEFGPQLARPDVASFIRKKFAQIRRWSNSPVIVEKTCANTLRIPFVAEILPDAKYIHIIRDGVDATGSAKLRWKAELDLPYILKKARFVPVTDLPYYGSRYIGNRLHRLFSGTKQLAYWGPTLDGMDSLLARYSLIEICALQWQQCVRKAEADLASLIPPERFFSVRYEHFVRAPQDYLEQIAAFLGIEIRTEHAAAAVADVSHRSIGKGRDQLTDDELGAVLAVIGSDLDHFHYEH